MSLALVLSDESPLSLSRSRILDEISAFPFVLFPLGVRCNQFRFLLLPCLFLD